MLRIKNTRIFVPAAILYAILIFYLSVTSNIGDLKHLLKITIGHERMDVLIAGNLSFVLSFFVSFLHLDKRQSIDLGHVGIYFGFGILLYFAFASEKNEILGIYSSFLAVCLGTAYGILNEIFQMYLPYRTASVADALSNLIGLVIAQLLVITLIFVVRKVQNWKKRKEGQ